MRYALNLAEDGRILSVAEADYAPLNSVFVDYIPEGDTYEYRYVEGKFIHEPSEEFIRDVKIERINELKRKLADTDYNIIKIVEGAATLTEMSDIISQRSKWRAEINEIEKDLT